MNKYIFTIIMCLATFNLSAIQVIYRSNPNRSDSETYLLNQNQQQMEIMRESLEVQKNILNEQKKLNRGW